MLKPSALSQRQKSIVMGSSIAGIAGFEVGNRISWLSNHVTGDALTRWTTAIAHSDLAFQSMVPSFDGSDLMAGAVIGGAAAIGVGSKLKGKRKFREGVEYGSARWSGPEDIKGFFEKNPDDNLIFSATEQLALDDSSIPHDKKRNKNAVVVGSSGSGKTFFVIEPNLMNASKKASYVITDPKGTLSRRTGKLLRQRGFAVKVFNLVDTGNSLHYNPLAYVHGDKDVLKLVNALIVNTKGEGPQAGEDFWVKAERLYLCALVAYICTMAPDEERNFNTLLELVNQSQAREEDEEYNSPVDELFESLKATDPDCFAVRQYLKYKQAAGKTAKSILISVGSRLAPFDIQELRDLMAYDELDLERIGDANTALFIQPSDSDTTFDFVTAVLYTQMFNLLVEHADKDCGGKLDKMVVFLLDEFANSGQIPGFEKLIATIRSRNMCAVIVLQTLSQLKAIYKDHSETIIGNCDTIVFLGGREPSTLKEMSETLGRETIDLMNESDTRGTNRSFGQNYQKTGRELMTKDELAVMPNDRCIVQIRALRPFYSKKYDPAKHKRWRLTADYDEKNSFVFSPPSIELVIDPDESFTFFEGEDFDI